MWRSRKADFAVCWRILWRSSTNDDFSLVQSLVCWWAFPVFYMCPDHTGESVWYLPCHAVRSAIVTNMSDDRDSEEQQKVVASAAWSKCDVQKERCWRTDALPLKQHPAEPRHNRRIMSLNSSKWLFIWRECGAGDADAGRKVLTSGH